MNFEEAQMKDLSDFKTFNELFTRKLKPGMRPVENPQNDKTICSPCDGRVLCFGDIKESAEGPCKYVMECIKGNNYPLDEFLFG